MIAPVTAPAITAKIGDVNPDTDTCLVVMQDSEGREVTVVEAPEDDLIPYMRMLGINLGVYLGNGTYRVL